MATREREDAPARARRGDEDEDREDDDEDAEPEVVDSGDEEEDAATGEADPHEEAADAEAKDAAAKNGDDGQQTGDEQGAEEAGSNEEGEGADEDGEEEDTEEVVAPVRKKPEPYEVPKSGHFYLHDDRTEVKEKTDGEDEQQATRPKKKLWADEKKWEHDKYVEDDDDQPAEGSRRNAARRARGGSKAGASRDQDSVQPRIEQRPSTHAKAARDGREGARGGRSGGRINERDEADPVPQAEPSLGRSARGQRGRGGQQMENQIPVVAIGGQLRPQGRGGRDGDYDRGATATGRGAYHATDRGGMVSMRGGVRAGGQVTRGMPADRGAMMPQRGRGRGGMAGFMGSSGMTQQDVVHQPPMRAPVNDDYDDPNDPFPALTERWDPGGPRVAKDQTVTVNIRGLGGRGPVQRTALDGGADDGFGSVGMPAANANRPGGRRARGPGEANFVPGTSSITPSMAMAPHFTPTSSMPGMASNNGMNGMNSGMNNGMQMANQLLQQQQQFQQQQMTTDMMQQQYNADMYAQQWPSQFAAAAQSQYYMMMPGADSQPQGTYFFAPPVGGSSQPLNVGGMGGSAMGSGGIGPGNQFSQYQQSLAQQQMQMAGGPMGPLPTGAMPFQPATTANQGAPAKPISRRYTQMSFGSNQQMDEMGQ